MPYCVLSNKGNFWYSRSHASCCIHIATRIRRSKPVQHHLFGMTKDGEDTSIRVSSTSDIVLQKPAPTLAELDHFIVLFALTTVHLTLTHT